MYAHEHRQDQEVAPPGRTGAGARRGGPPRRPPPPSPPPRAPAAQGRDERRGAAADPAPVKIAPEAQAVSDRLGWIVQRAGATFRHLSAARLRTAVPAPVGRRKGERSRWRRDRNRLPL